MGRAPRIRVMRAVLPLATLTASCTLFTSFDDFIEPVTEPALDGGTEIGPTNDDASAGGDVDQASDGGAPFSCASAGASFCDDFERDDPRGEWTALLTQRDASAAIARNGTNRVLAIRSPSVPGGGTTYAHVKKTFSSANATAEAVLSFRLFVHRQPTASLHAATISTEVADGIFYFGLHLRPTGAIVFEQFVPTSGADDQYRDSPLGQPIVPGRWYEVRLAIDLSTRPARYAISVDGDPVLTMSSDVGFAEGRPTFSVGCSYSPEPPGFDADYDDVVIDVR